MLPPAPAPSTRLLRAAVAERADLRRHRQQLLAARETLRAEMARIEASLDQVQQREDLLERLTGPTREPDLTSATATAAPPADADSATQRERVLRGPAIRRAAVEVLLVHPDRPEALHYRDWYETLMAAGYSVAGKDPVAVFLTQLSRSPAVRKGTQSGVYELDRGAPRRLRRKLEGLHDELRRVAGIPGDTTNLAAGRARRAQLNTEIAHVEKALEEAENALSSPREASSAGEAV